MDNIVIAMSTSMIVNPLLLLIIVPPHQRAWPSGEIVRESEAVDFANFTSIQSPPIAIPVGAKDRESPATEASTP
jgi:hypothetical protein